MMRFTLLLFVAFLSGAGRLAAQEKVEARGITSVIKIEEVIFGHLTELNDKYKMRAEYFFETGNLAHTAENKSNIPLRILFVEVLPKNRAAPTAVPPSAQ